MEHGIVNLARELSRTRADASSPCAANAMPDMPTQPPLETPEQSVSEPPELSMSSEHMDDPVSYDANWEWVPDPYTLSTLSPASYDGGNDSDDATSPSPYAAHVVPQISSLNCDVAFL